MYAKECTEDDISELVRVALESYNAVYLYLWYDKGEKYKANSFNPEAFRQQIHDSNVALFLIYEEKGKPAAGFLKLNIDKAYGDMRENDALELERIYLIKEVSGKGVGRKVLQFVDEFARERSKKYIWLKVMDSSSAIEFYSKSGYKIIADYTLTFLEMKEEFRGMHVMTKSLI